MERLQRAVYVFLILLLISISKLSAQNSNIGTEFWTGWMDHVSSASGMVLYIASDVNTSGTVAFTDGITASIPFTVKPNVVTLVDIPSSQFLGDYSGISSKGIHITSLGPIAVYAHIYDASISGATLLLPVNTLANDYYSLNFTQISNSLTQRNEAKPSYSTLMFIATEDNTTVEITPSADLLADATGVHPAGVKFQVTLQKGQLYQALSNIDLTGTHVESVSTSSGGCKRIAMFSGSSKISIGSSNTVLSFNGSADNLFQQVYPTASWGKNYITVPLKARNYDIYRVVVSDPSAVVKLNGSVLTNLTNNLYYQFSSQSTNVITADKPVQVVQYAVTQGEKIDGTTFSGDIGDPEMIYLNPLEQNIDHVTLYSTDRAAINAKLSFINVVIPTVAASSFLIDGVSPSGFAVVPGNTAYSYGQFFVTKGATHVISASQGFNAIAYGFGPTESYGYAAGTNVKNLNEYVQYVDPATQKVLTSGCTNVSLTPQIVLPYITTKLVWDFGNNVIETVNNPANTQITKADGTMLYQYTYSQPITYGTAGTYTVKVTATDPITTACGSDEDVYLNYTIFDPPKAKFSSRDSICLADTVDFKDQTDISLSGTATYLWNFGDGQTSTTQNPVHTYTAANDYPVTLTVTGSTGCATSFQKKVHVSVPPVAKFNVPPPTCEAPLSVTFTDQSSSVEGKIVTWLWDFGDGATSSLQNPTHIYAAANTYNVNLTVITDKGCSNTLLQKPVINYSPKPDFAVPSVCEADNFTYFTSSSMVNNATPDASTIYLWNFGDTLPGSVSVNNPNTATGKSVQHQYHGVGRYNVTLTVTTGNSCVRDTTKVLTINGAHPKADFAIVNKRVCSNQPAVFINKAHVPGLNRGKVDNFTIDFGDGSAIQPFTIDSGEVFTHKYPTEYTKLVTKYVVTMTAFSGTSIECQSSYTDTVYVLPVPQTTFTPPATICQNFGKLQLASYVTPYPGGPTGAAVFYIDNLRSPDGVFNTNVVGAGSHLVTCYYILNSTGCADTTKATITVEPVASVDAGRDVVILAGGLTSLKPTIIGGNNLQYLWSPAKGLNDATLKTPTAAPAVTTTYKLTVTSTTDGLACPVSDSVKVTVLQAPVVPNTFTPNGDSKNDVWNINGLDTYPGCIVAVYNRNGERVFYSIGYATPWDGRYNSVNLPVGTYYYIIDPKNGRSKISGAVTIIR